MGELMRLQETPLYQYLLRDTITEPLHAMLALRYEEAVGTSIEVTAATRKQCYDKIVAKEGAVKVDSFGRLLAVLSGKPLPKDSKDGKESKDTAKKDKGSKDKGAKDKKKKGKDDDDDDDDNGPKEKTAKAKKKKGKDEEDDDDDRDQGKETDDPLDLYHMVADDVHIYCRKVDKKREKSAVQEQAKACRDRLRDIPASDLTQMCTVGLQLAVLQEGVPGLLYPAESWGFRLVACRLKDEVLRDEAIALCVAAASSNAQEGTAGAVASGASADYPKEYAAAVARGQELSGNPVNLEAAAAAWREKLLASSK